MAQSAKLQTLSFCSGCDLRVVELELGSLSSAQSLPKTLSPSAPPPAHIRAHALPLK